MQRFNVDIYAGENKIVLNKIPTFDGSLRVDFSFYVSQALINRIVKTGIVTLYSRGENYIYVSRKDFYTHEKMTEILTDIIENYGNLQNQEQEKEKARAV